MRISDTDFSWTTCPSCHPVNGVKALTSTSGLILSSLTTGQALVPLCQLS